MSLACLACLAGLGSTHCSSSPGAAALPEPEGGTDAGAGDEPPACLASSACGQAPLTGQECVTTMSATVVDGTGAPVQGLPVFLCGTNLCSEPSRTAADGTVEVAVCLPFAAPALKVFSDPQWAPFAALLPSGGPSFALGTVPVVALPAAGAALASGSGTVTSGGVSVTLASATVTFDVEHPTPDSQLFRVVAVPPAELPSTLQGGVTAAWGLAPLNTKLVPAAQLALPNTPGWAAGAAVDVYIDGTDPSATPPPAPWGAWGLLGTGAVSSDGASIVLTPAQGGLPEIAMVGVKLH
ncbi:MAG: hypothetical protein ACRELB_20295 [Polyangiaceae bacterium]